METALLWSTGEMSCHNGITGSIEFRFRERTAHLLEGMANAQGQWVIEAARYPGVELGSRCLRHFGLCPLS